MARALPIVDRRRLEQGSSDDPVLLFAAIRHKQLTDPVRLVLDGADYVMDDEDGNAATWHQSYFTLTLLTDDARPPQASFTFPNVDRRSSNMIADVIDPATVDFKLIAASYFNLAVEPRTVKAGLTVAALYQASSLFLTDVKIGLVQVTGTLRGIDLRQQLWPLLRATQDRLPGVFMR
ncbi:MAG: hypothetical protein BGN87_06200 [Rhizobiales bacterium 65-79]|jgi:hypothetical protein|nr:MAG: hypothetical protein BGN87_06200 [Rhizobiales bacterium 65-79]